MITIATVLGIALAVWYVRWVAGYVGPTARQISRAQLRTRDPEPASGYR